MSRLRTFIALDPGKPIRDRLRALQEQLSNTGVTVKWVEPENLHVTLLFLGEVEQKEVNNVCRAVGAVAAEIPAFGLSIEGAGAFPNVRQPRIVWVGVGAGAAEVCSLHDRLENALLNLGCYRREERKYTPHVTLGRVRNERSSSALEAAIKKKEKWHAGETTISEVLVLSSELARNGPEYSVLSRVALKG